MKTYLFTFGFLIFTCLACSQGGYDSLKERAGLEAQEVSKEQIEAENENLRIISTAMEADLARRHRLFQSLRGTFAGEITTDIGPMVVRLKLAPSRNPYPVDRVRRPEEVATDISSLHMNGAMDVFPSDNPSAGSSCVVESLPVDMVAGRIDVISSACKNYFVFHLGVVDEAETVNLELFQRLLLQQAPVMASQFLEGTKKSVNAVMGKITIRSVARDYASKLLRTEP